MTSQNISFQKAFILAVVFTVLLAGCNFPGPGPSPATEGVPEVIFSTPTEPGFDLAATQTSVAAGLSGTAVALQATQTSVASQATQSAPAATATPTPTQTSTSQPSPTSVAPTATEEAGVSAGCTYQASFVADVTIQDGSTIPAGTEFVKTWRVRNDGTCTWGPEGYNLYGLAFVSGSRMGAPSVVALPEVVTPGETVDISVRMTAPASPGRYQSRWMFVFQNGSLLGVGSQGESALYTEIVVSGTQSTTTRTKLRFESGATSVQVDGSLKAGQEKGYVLRALEGQFLMANLSPNAAGAKLDLTDAQGDQISLEDEGQQGQYILARLPSDQEYVVWVIAGQQDVQYSLNIEIPARVSFAPGATGEQVEGNTDNRRTVSYVLRALGGQTMTLDLNAGSSPAALAVYGLQDGQPLLRAPSERTSWTGTLPKTQDYIVEVVPGTDRAFSYTLDIVIK